MPIMKTNEAIPQLEKNVLDVLDCYRDRLEPHEILAVIGTVAGKLIAFQNSNLYTADEAMDVLLNNVEIGNKYIMDEVEKATRTIQ